jgi:uncharacterized membrane protein
MGMVELNFVTIGVLVVIIGVVLFFVGMSQQAKGKTKIEGGGIFFIGPIPIIGATSEKALYITLAVAVIFIIVFVLLRFLGR